MLKKLLQKTSFSLENITKIDEKVEQTNFSLENINDLKNKNYLLNKFQKWLKDKKEEEILKKRREAYKKSIKEREERIRIAVQKDWERKQQEVSKNKLFLKNDKVEQLEQKIKELEQRVKNLEKQNIKQKSENELIVNIDSINSIDLHNQSSASEYKPSSPKM